jgi:Tfp pilus assembly protein PilO
MLIVTIVVAVLVTGAFAALIYMDSQSIDEEKAKIEATDRNLAKAEVEIERMRDRERDVIIYREILETEAEILPDQEEINEFWRTITEFKESSGVQIDRIEGLDQARSSRSKKGPGQAITPIQIQLKVVASFHQLLNFLNKFENYKRLVSITDLTIAAGDPTKSPGDPSGIRHNVTMKLTTYIYNPRGGSVKQVEIPYYDRRLEQDEIKRGIRKMENPNKEVYLLKPGLDRRDPLVSPRKPPVDDIDPDVDPQVLWENQNNLLERLLLSLQFIQQDWEIEKQLMASDPDETGIRYVRVRKELDVRIADLELEIKDVKKSRKITFDDLKDQFESQVVAPFTKLLAARPAEPVKVPVSQRQVRECLESMRSQYEKREYKKVLDAYTSYKAYREGRELPADARRMDEEIIEIARRATVVSDFESRTIVIGALIVDGDRSVALINGKSVSVGDPIEAGSKILLCEVRSDGCTFLYEDVRIPRSIRQGKGSVSGRKGK